MSNKIRETFNDGLLKIVTQETQRDEQKKRLGTAYKEVGKAHFKNMMLRDSDLDSFNKQDVIVSKKVKTNFHPIVKNKNKSDYFIQINEDVYSVSRVDYDVMYAYFYLSRVGETND